MEASPSRGHPYTHDPELATPPPRSSASYASSGGLPPFFSSSGIVTDGTTPHTSFSHVTPAKDPHMQSEGQADSHIPTGIPQHASTHPLEAVQALVPSSEPRQGSMNAQLDFIEPSAPSPGE